MSRLRFLWFWLFDHEQPYICAASYNPCIRSPATHWLDGWWSFNRRPRVRYDPQALVMRGGQWLATERVRFHIADRRLATGDAQNPWQHPVSK